MLVDSPVCLPSSSRSLGIAKRYVTATGFQWVLEIRTLVLNPAQKALCLASCLPSHGMSTLTGIDSTFPLHWFQSSLQGFETMYCQERSRRWGSDFPPMFSFLYISALCHVELLTLPSPSPHASLTFQSPCSLYQCTELALVCPLSTFQPLTLIAKVSEVEIEVTLETFHQGEKMNENN